ncbi:VOC family protein [Modestobacter sp. Leaf380]|uniref:VOC family protein n=1 Tax=Modestobacter sp. Leaf380 TaxID=1736356 RepID=UPI0006FB3D2D|nr:VOC family protein [Modestobacter sp. Leaf380]KQS66094.1 glyoxalase [Modestobacter sp. Leaf380]
MPITTTHYAHVRLTVTDIDRSRAFYDSVFALPVAIDGQAEGAPDFAFGGVIYALGESLLGLRPVSEDEFSEDRTGLDHVAFAVSSREALDEAAAHLDSLGIAHEGVKDIGAGYILEFRDPDNIALELMAPPAA